MESAIFCREANLKPGAFPCLVPVLSTFPVANTILRTCCSPGLPWICWHAFFTMAMLAAAVSLIDCKAQLVLCQRNACCYQQ